MPTTVTISIGSRTSDSVTVNTVTTTTVSGFSSAWSVVLSASVPATTKIGDKLTTSARDYLITNISGSTLTVVGDPFTTAVAPSTGPGAATTRSFPSISTWTGGAPASLVTSDWVWKGELYKEGGGTNGEWSVSLAPATYSATCDPTRYYFLTAASGQSFADNANKLTNALRYNNANGVAIYVPANYVWLFDVANGSKVVVSNVQIKSDYKEANAGLGEIEFYNCVFSYGGGSGCLKSGASVANCLIYLSTASVVVYGAVQNKWFRNCTIFGNGANDAFIFSNYSSSNTIKNCAVFGFLTGVVNGVSYVDTATSTNNITDLASFGWSATGNLVSKVATNQFVSITGGSEDFRIKAGADVINAGTPDATYTNNLDIVGSARSLTTPTIGAWEYAAVTPTATDYSSPLSRGIFRGIERGVA